MSKFKKQIERMEEIKKLEKKAKEVQEELKDLNINIVFESHKENNQFGPLIRISKEGCETTIPVEFLYEDKKIYIARHDKQDTIMCLIVLKNQELLKMSSKEIAKYIKHVFDVGDISNDDFYLIYLKNIR